MERYDVAIIGTGAGGGTRAWTLAPTGKKILLLERGQYVPREPDNWSTRAISAGTSCRAHEVDNLYGWMRRSSRRAPR